MLVWRGLYSLEVSPCTEAPEPLQENEGKTSHPDSTERPQAEKLYFSLPFTAWSQIPPDHFLCLKINEVKELKAKCSPRMLGGRGYSVRLVGSSTKEETKALNYGLWLPATACSSMLIGPLILSVRSNILSSYQNTCRLPFYPTRQFTGYPALQSRLIYPISVTPH